ncbi:hypothetical protein F5Y10DRAFT_186351 [Nemania abortiva]|nr:hypothetical protein F5Y10DRAFT_186351 [Nemania abortiva]
MMDSTPSGTLGRTYSQATGSLAIPTTSHNKSNIRFRTTGVYFGYTQWEFTASALAFPYLVRRHRGVCFRMDTCDPHSPDRDVLVILLMQALRLAQQSGIRGDNLLVLENHPSGGRPPSLALASFLRLRTNPTPFGRSPCAYSQVCSCYWRRRDKSFACCKSKKTTKKKQNLQALIHRLSQTAGLDQPLCPSFFQFLPLCLCVAIVIGLQGKGPFVR